MADAYIPDFGTKDPDDIEPKNFDARKRLVDLGNPTVANATVTAVKHDVAFGTATLEAAAALVITDVIWDNTAKRVSFRWAGGTVGIRYLVTCRLFCTNGVQVDQSAYVTIATNH